MAFAFADMVQTTSATTGAADYVIAADAVGAFQSVEDGIGAGNWSLFSAVGSDGFEIFKGTLSIAGAVHTLSRDTVYAGSNGTSKVNWGSGTRVIQCVAPAVVLSMLYDPTRTGFAVQTGATGMVGRTLAAGNGLSWTNADGISGNPSLALVLDGASLAVTGSGLAIAALGVATGHLANGAVTQIKIANDAVDLTELAHATQGDILYWGASGVPARLGAGTAGQFLKTQGGGANPVWGDVPDPPPSPVVAWVLFAADGTIAASSGISSVVQNSTGVWTVTLSAAMDSTNYVVTPTPNSAAGSYVPTFTITSTTVFVVRLSNGNSGSPVDPTVGMGVVVTGVAA